MGTNLAFSKIPVQKGWVGKQVLEEVEGLEERGNVDGGIECQAAPASGRQQQQQLQQRQGQTVAAR